MSKGGAFLAGSALVAAAAGGAWFFVLRPRVADLEARTLAAERAAQRAKRDAADSQEYAESERRRKRELEDETTNLKKLLSAAPPPPSTMAGHHPPAPAPDGGGLAPEQWDMQRVRQEITSLSATPTRIVGNPRYPLVARAVKAKTEESVSLLTEALGQPLDPGMHAVCAILFGALGDTRGVKPLLAVWKTATDPDLRHALLTGLANLPGDDALPLLVDAWNDPLSDARTRVLAMHGLARRRHEIALAVAVGGAPGSTPPLRFEALRTLHAQAAKSEWKDASLLPVFGKALRTADGDAQRKAALAALEGYWSKDALADLDAYAASATTTDLGARAKKTADAIREGKPRPENAGVPTQELGAPSEAEPGEAEEPAAPKKDPPK